MKTLLAGVLALATMSPAPAKQTFAGIVTDEMCAMTGHAAMQMGPTDAECVTACVNLHGTSYVLLAGKNIYALSNQKALEPFAAVKVMVVGTLNAKTKTIEVESITAQK